MEVLIRRHPFWQATGCVTYLLAVLLALFVGSLGGVFVAWALAGFNEFPPWLFYPPAAALTAWIARGMIRELRARDFSEVRLEDQALVLVRGRRTWTWPLEDLQEFRMTNDGLRLKGADGTPLQIREMRPEALTRLRQAAIPAMADSLSRRLEAGEVLDIRQPAGPLVAAFLSVGMVGFLFWVAGVHLWEQAWAGWVVIGVCLPVMGNILRQFRTGGLVISLAGLQDRRSGATIPWSEVTGLAADPQSLAVVTRRGGFTLAGAASPEPLALVLARRIRSVRPTGEPGAS